MNAVAPGPTDTGMLTRFTGTAENKAALPKQFRSAGSASPRKSPTASSSSVRTEPWITGDILNVDGGMTAG